MRNMTVTGAFASAIFVVAIGAAIAEYPAPPETDETDQVVASFERELTRESGPAPRIERDSIDEDELYRAMNEVHWTAEDAASPEALVAERENDDGE